MTEQADLSDCSIDPAPVKTGSRTIDIAALGLSRFSHGLLGLVDHVTLLPNRIQLIRAMGSAHRLTLASSYLILVTLADARHYNEILRALGHSFADDFVRIGAAAVARCMPPGIQLYHVSVLSFAFVIDTAESGPPVQLLETLVRTLRRPLQCADVPIATRAGVGLLALMAQGSSPAESLRSTLVAAQDSRGRAEGWAEYNRRSDEAHQRAFQMLTDLRQALLRQGELSIVYQPRVDLRSGRTTGAEALIRWVHPTLGAISPGEFIPLAEATAVMGPLTDWILTTVLQGIQAWPACWGAVTVSVNISPSSLHQPNFVDRIEALLRAFAIAPERLELEFTEGTLASTDATVMDQIARIRRLGMTIAIDDFGTGYSNLDYLTRLPAQVLKIDQSFIRTMDTEPRRQVLTKAIIEMAHALGYRVVAEGIETQEILDRLREWDCDEGQGYFISRPLPEASFRAWLHERMR